MAHVIARKRVRGPRFLGGRLWLHTGERRELAADHKRERQGSNRGDQALARSGVRFQALILWELIGVPGA
jgi:hypothetical protein